MFAHLLATDSATVSELTQDSRTLTDGDRPGLALVEREDTVFLLDCPACLYVPNAVSYDRNGHLRGKP